MARKAPPISVKDLTAALAIGKEQGKQESLVAEKRPDSPVKKPGGPPWPGYPNPMPPGKDWPVELAINANNIRRTGTPPLVNDNDYGPGSDKWPQTPGRDWQISHGEHFGDRGEIIQDPGFGIDPGGNPIRLPHMEQTPEEQERNKGLHDWKYHDGEEPDTFDKVLEVASELNSNQLKILKEIPSNINKLDSSERLKIMRDITGRVMKAELPANNIRRLSESGHTTVPDPDNPGRLKIIDSLGPQAGLNLGGGRFLYNYEIKMLRDQFTGASEKERNRLIEMYSDKPFRGLVQYVRGDLNFHPRPLTYTLF